MSETIQSIVFGDEQEPRVRVYPGLYPAAAVAAMRVAAAESDELIEIDEYDPADPSDLSKYAEISALSDTRNVFRGLITREADELRSAEQIAQDIGPHAVEYGLVPVVIRTSANSLTAFWARQREVLVQQKQSD